MTYFRKSVTGIAVMALTGFLLHPGSIEGQTANGQAEFFSGTKTFKVPAGISRIRAYVYGAGGGAGATINPSHPGANGGSGAFSEGVIAVTAGEELTITVGAGGVGGSPGTFKAGSSGGTSKIVNPENTVLISAGGGGGGTCSGCIPKPGSGGAAGIGPSGSILHSGPAGSGCGGGQTRCAYPLWDYSADVAVGGRGVFTGSNEFGTSTINGIGGYIYLEW